MGRRQDLLLIAVQDGFIQDGFNRLNPSDCLADHQWSAFCCQLAKHPSANENQIKRQ
jgi:hypothetical protein